MCAAGVAAEAQLYGRDVRDYYAGSIQAQFGAGQDLLDIALPLREAFTHAGGSGAGCMRFEMTMMGSMLDGAQGLCAHNWPYIQAIAETLLVRRRLPGSFVHYCCEGATVPTAFRSSSPKDQRAHGPHPSPG
jgi:hypothetical protein